MKDITVSELVNKLNKLINYQFSGVRIKGELNNSFIIDRVEVSPDGAVLLVSDNLVSDLENALGADL